MEAKVLGHMCLKAYDTQSDGANCDSVSQPPPQPANDMLVSSTPSMITMGGGAMIVQSTAVAMQWLSP